MAKCFCQKTLSRFANQILISFAKVEGVAVHFRVGAQRNGFELRARWRILDVVQRLQQELPEARDRSPWTGSERRESGVELQRGRRWLAEAGECGRLSKLSRFELYELQTQ